MLKFFKTFHVLSDPDRSKMTLRDLVVKNISLVIIIVQISIHDT
jgi:hypothetical protein